MRGIWLPPQQRSNGKMTAETRNWGDEPHFRRGIGFGQPKSF
jgi:hypothetical protein